MDALHMRLSEGSDVLECSGSSVAAGADAFSSGPCEPPSVESTAPALRAASITADDAGASRFDGTFDDVPNRQRTASNRVLWPSSHPPPLPAVSAPPSPSSNNCAHRRQSPTPLEEHRSVALAVLPSAPGGKARAQLAQIS
eukprot:scaffold208650_cov27-Tisochrysis_lutea.AAC.5